LGNEPPVSEKGEEFVAEKELGLMRIDVRNGNPRAIGFESKMEREPKQKPPYSHHLSRNASGATPYFSNSEIRLAAYFCVAGSACA
jgi:hypothetical protein